jgi:lipopolysaccharide/colanic/teichoic acid biosynthesis glycosyltransferase
MVTRITSWASEPPLTSRYHWIDEFQPEKRLLTGQTYLIAKRALDLLIVVLAFPVLLPLIGFCALLIKLEEPQAPVFFVQERTGRGGRRFRMFKFRTMVANAEELKQHLACVNADGELAGPIKLENDPRVTRVGRALRKTSLDELPQLLNVVKGEMSLVGPRPTSFGLKSYQLWHTERLDVLPGLTGLWQLYGRGSTDFNDWLRWDICYLERRCLWLDIQIVFRTAFTVLQQRGAH